MLNQVSQYEKNPFDPDAIARLRPSAYQKAVVMKYLEMLIAWGDSLYGQNTRESIAEATQIYVEPSTLLDPSRSGFHSPARLRTILMRDFSPLAWIRCPTPAWRWRTCFRFLAGLGAGRRGHGSGDQ